MTQVIHEVILNEKPIGETVVEWDTEKNLTNIKKHRISFESAALVFADVNRVEYYDYLHSVDEDRFIVIGFVDQIIFVVYTARSEAVRIISARLADKRERDVYYGKRRRRKDR